MSYPAQCIDFFVGKTTDNGRSSEEIVFTELGFVGCSALTVLEAIR